MDRRSFLPSTVLGTGACALGSGQRGSIKVPTGLTEPFRVCPGQIVCFEVMARNRFNWKPKYKEDDVLGPYRMPDELTPLWFVNGVGIFQLRSGVLQGDGLGFRWDFETGVLDMRLWGDPDPNYLPGISRARGWGDWSYDWIDNSMEPCNEPCAVLDKYQEPGIVQLGCYGGEVTRVEILDR